MNLPGKLVECMASGLSLPWCGSGISVESKLPTWAELVRSMMDEASTRLTQEQRIELDHLYSQRAFEDIVDYCRGALGDQTCRDFLISALDHGIPNDIHCAVVRMPVPAILTTNYDRLLETAFAQTRGALPHVNTANDATTLWEQLARREFFILKVHGDLTRFDTLVFTSRDYTEQLFGNHPFMAFLKRVMLSHSFLFIGASLLDFYTRRILEETSYMTRGKGLPHFAILPNVGAVQSRILLDRYNIQAISYPITTATDHKPRILEILETLMGESKNYSLSFRSVPSPLRKAIMDKLVEAYPYVPRVMLMASSVGIPPWAINWNAAAANVWDQVIALATRDRKLTTLLEHFATDPTVAAYRESVKELLAPVREWESGT